MVRLLIADKHEVTVEGLRQILKLEPSVTAVVNAASEQQIFSCLAEGTWALLLYEIKVSPNDGIDLLRRIHIAHPHLRTLVVTGLPEEHYALGAVKAGACGYISKGAAADELLVAVRRVLSGQRYFSERMTARMSSTSMLSVLPHEALSTREMQVFKLIGTGMMVTAIAQQLQLSVKTISTYRTRILEKMGLQSNADIVTYVTRHHLFD